MIIGNKVFKLKNAIGTLALFMLLSGCSTYATSFGCGDAPGAKCMPMDKVDKLIVSGEIEEYTKTQKCKGIGCKRKKILKEEEPPILNNDQDKLTVEFNN